MAGKSKLSIEQQQEVVRLYLDGDTLGSIAAKFNVSDNTILAYCKRAGITRPKVSGRPRQTTCSVCGERPAFLGGKCKECKALQLREYHLQRKYGIGIPDYERILAEQGGCCALCGKTKSMGAGVFHVDHCHDTGRIRGLLCYPCNYSLGVFGDNIAGLERVIDYIRRGL